MQRQDYDLQRFKNAQEQSYAGYQEALQEIRNGCKVGHWIWYIFPQVKGLGRSGMSDYYGLRGVQEAKAYMEDPLLRERLLEITTALLRVEGKSAVEILGDIDTKKVRSCMTLFAEVAPQEPVFKEVLEKYYQGKVDRRTLGLVGEK